jgi:hypothetical protein
MKKEPFLIRQGDVGLIAVEEIPAGALEQKRDSAGRIVLAYGEVTGHAHAFHDLGVMALKAANADVFLRVVEPVMLRHEEHTHIEVPPGMYRVLRQREWSDSEEPILVAD